MIARLGIATIVLFWGAMWALLIRMELRPEEAGLLEVPPAYAARIFFQHEQSSDLFISDARENLGMLRLQPRRGTTGERLVDYSGHLQLRLPGSPPLRINWDGTAEFTPAWELRRLRLGLGSRESHPKATAPAQRIDLLLQPDSQRGEYTHKVGDDVVEERQFTLDEAGLRELATRLGWTLPAGAPALPPLATPEVRARLSTTEVRGEPIATCHVALSLNGQTLGELHLSQLGQVLQVRTPFGWKLDAE